MHDFAEIARLIEALRPWHGDLVFVGGWAHRLYRFHPSALQPSYQAVRTRDADVAFSLQARLKGDIAEALLEAGFRQELSSEHEPPISQYRLGAEDEGFYAEFLTPLLGSDTRRDGSLDATVEKAGVTAQKLRHLDLLLVSPWTVNLGPETGVPLERTAVVRLPSAVSFIAQKLLIRSMRLPDKKAQDALYIHDTLDLFSGNLAELRAEWLEKHRPFLSGRIAAEIDLFIREQFSVVDDVIRRAVRIPQDRSLPAERLRAVCEYGLRQIFGERDAP